MTDIKVTVLMPVYNASLHLREAIDSILAQTYTGFEFLIINDGSTDDSEDIILSYRDSRIRYIKNESNIRLIATLNKGIEEACGKYIVRMDADDIALPSRIEKQVAFMDANPQTAICGSWFESFGAKNVITQYEEKHEGIMFRMLYQCHLCHPSLILRKEHLKSFDMLFDPDFAHAEDYDFFVRVGQRYKLANLQEILIKYRIHAGSVSAKYKPIQDENSNRIRRREFQKLGYSITDQEIDDFTKLNHQDYNSIKSGKDSVMKLLDSLALSNRKTNTFDTLFFEQKLSELWFHYCYHTTSYKSFIESDILSVHSKPTTIQRLKWLLK